MNKNFTEEGEFKASILLRFIESIVGKDGEKVNDFINGLKNLYDSAKKSEFLENLSIALNNFSYLKLLNEVEWPLFIRSDEEIKRRILSISDYTGISRKRLSKVICEYYNKEKVNNIFNSWRSILCKDVERFMIFKEAVDLHNRGFYYGSTALLMSQVFGIVSVSYEDIKRLKINVPREQVSKLCEILKVDSDLIRNFHDDKKERQQLLRLPFFTKRFMLWVVIINYIFNVTFVTNSKSLADNNPLRNKICHGEQLNFGTEEKSLKSILTIDLLLNLRNEINAYIEKIKYTDENLK